LSRLPGLLRLVEPRASRPAIREKGLHALEMIARLGQLPLGGREIRLRRPQRVALVLRFEPRQHLIRLDPIPDLRSLSMMRPAMRKLSVTSSWASMRPVSVIVTPACCFSTVAVRTGRGSGGAASTSG
jgi:hypothetical protein